MASNGGEAWWNTATTTSTSLPLTFYTGGGNYGSPLLVSGPSPVGPRSALERLAERVEETCKKARTA